MNRRNGESGAGGTGGNYIGTVGAGSIGEGGKSLYGRKTAVRVRVEALGGRLIFTRSPFTGSDRILSHKMRNRIGDSLFLQLLLDPPSLEGLFPLRY